MNDLNVNSIWACHTDLRNRCDGFYYNWLLGDFDIWFYESYNIRMEADCDIWYKDVILSESKGIG